ncbi:MAG: oligosaccharide flippase family protein [Saprospiraceae bacterium]|nr:oligosaccharide flippase family protein [Saprospiraceae bacterium]MCB9345810.1 oligosaccharide flippase family protein [Lewinellaceae bacterium]
MSLVKKLAGETALYGLSSIIGRFLNVMLVPLYTRTLGQGEYGVVTDLYAIAAFLIIVYSYRMESAFFRFGTPKEDRERSFSTGLTSLLISTGIITGLLFLFSQPIATAAKYGDHPEYIRWFALMLAFDCLAELPFARLRLEQRPIRFVSIKLVWIVSNISLNLFWLVFCPWAAEQGMDWVHWFWTPDRGVGYIFLSNVLASLFTLILLLPEFRAMRLHIDRELWTKMMRYASPLIIVGFAGMVNEMLSRTMMKYLLTGTYEENMAQLGVFGANYKLAMLITLFTQAYRYAAEPFFFRHAADENAMQTQSEVTKWFTITAAVGMLGILLFLDIVKHFLGKDFHSGVGVVPILLCANLLLGIYYNFSVWFRLKDRTGLGAWISLAGAGITIVLNILWIPTFGYVGAAWVTLICYLFMSWATWQTGRKNYPVPYQMGRMAWYAFSAIALWWITRLLEPVLPLSMLWTLRVVFFFAYLVMIWFLELRGKNLNLLNPKS